MHQPPLLISAFSTKAVADPDKAVYMIHRLDGLITWPASACWSTWEMYSQASIDTKTSLRRTGVLFFPFFFFLPTAPVSTAFRHSISRNWRSRVKMDGRLHSISRMFCPTIALHENQNAIMQLLVNPASVSLLVLCFHSKRWFFCFFVLFCCCCCCCWICILTFAASSHV